MSTPTINFAEEELNARQEAVDAPRLKPTMPEAKATIGLLVNDRPGVLVELAIYLVLGVVWALPLKAVFRGVGQADPDKKAE